MSVLGSPKSPDTPLQPCGCCKPGSAPCPLMTSTAEKGQFFRPTTGPAAMNQLPNTQFTQQGRGHTAPLLSPNSRSRDPKCKNNEQTRCCCPKTYMGKSSTPIGILWALLSIMVAGTCSFSFLQPFWFIDPDNLNSFGMYSYCVKDIRQRVPQQVCGIYGGYFHFSNLPSNAWQAACVLYGGGCAFLCLGAFGAMLTLCMPHICDKRLALFTGYIQTMAVLIMLAGLLVYPLGLESRFVQHYCEQSRAYDAGSCQLGWGYMLAIMGTALAMFCPFLSQFTDMKVQESVYV